ncbi:hypothetical protein [Antarcticimicrobium sediminis]|uniref:Uncharacterized protein n=1 Tax=Antarcticimicrobium sediminis TaxID=2546227 RepID=A0A4R5ENN9_9RHOB|nr:hypothetical protein [Antarcticimicrobium sediminis]TDE36228.1 hypothetical protein E1B25_15040 [Antarcticimicrobium sediminis]
MDTDLVLILGLILVFFAIPAAMSAYSDNRPPLAPAATLLIAGGMIAYAYLAHPAGYTMRDVPEVFFTVVGRYLP